MKIIAKLNLFSILIILVTTLAFIVGASVLNQMQTTRDNQVRLKNAVTSIELRIGKMISNLDEALQAYTDNEEHPPFIDSEIYRMSSNFEPTSNYLAADLIKLGKAAKVESFAFYFPKQFGGSDEWQYLYSSAGEAK